MVPFFKKSKKRPLHTDSTETIPESHFEMAPVTDIASALSRLYAGAQLLSHKKKGDRKVLAPFFQNSQNRFTYFFILFRPKIPIPKSPIPKRMMVLGSGMPLIPVTGSSEDVFQPNGFVVS
jgi:hypothetical protein